MNTKHLLALFLFTSTVLSQTVLPSSVADMTPELMNEAVNENALIPGGPVTLRKLVADAVALKRIDLIQTCFINRHTVGDTLSAVAALPNNEVKQKAVIMMMRTPSTTCWPSENPLRAFSGEPATGVIEPIISTIPSLLQGEVLTKEMVATQAARHQLADRLLAALIAKGTTITEDEKNLLAAPSPTTVNDKAPVPQGTLPVPAQPPHAASAKTTSAAAIAQGTEAGSPRFWWLMGGGAATAVVILTYFALRKPN